MKYKKMSLSLIAILMAVLVFGGKRLINRIFHRKAQVRQTAHIIK